MAMSSRGSWPAPPRRSSLPLKVQAVELGGALRLGSKKRKRFGEHVVKAGTKYAVLGLLLERPSYGYEVLVRFRGAFDAGQWAVSAQGLYAALDRLQRDGLIEPVNEQIPDGRRRQPKTPYRVTNAGARALRDFLDTPMKADPSRAEFLVRLQCAVSKDAEALLALLDGYENACLDELGRMGAEAQEEHPGAAGQGGRLAERLAIEDRRLGIQARLTWIEYARQQLRCVASSADGALLR
jgi:DNA-binding PadR family transcriptional regulator